MSFPTAGGGFLVLLLSASVVQGQYGWTVTYSAPSHQICASKGTTVEISCTYTFPDRVDGKENKLLQRFWFNRRKDEEFLGIETALNSSGRVKNSCDGNKCILRISELRETDSAHYFFRFITNLNRYFGFPGVGLYIRDLQVQVSRWRGRLLLVCLSSCPGDTSFIWMKNGQKVKDGASRFYFPSLPLTESYSCAVPGYEESPSAPVYAPKLPSVSASPSGEVVEGSSVTLTCSTDANPAANYTWYKEDKDSILAKEPIFTITEFRAEHSGKYVCEAENMFGRQNSTSRLIVVAEGGTPALVGGSVTVVLLVLVLLLTFLWIRVRKKNSSSSPEAPPEDRADADDSEKWNPDRGQPEEQEDLQYASVCFSKNQSDLYSNIRPAPPSRYTELQEVSEYAVVKRSSSTTR